MIRSEKKRITSPQVGDADQTAQAAGNAACAVDLYQAIADRPGNLFFSPHSISVALAMTYAGAKGDTATQMATALHFKLPQDKLHGFFNKLDLELSSRREGKKGADQKPFRLNIVNATWGQKDYTFLDPFLDTLAENYDAGMRLLDFAKEAEPSRKTIND